MRFDLPVTKEARNGKKQDLKLYALLSFKSMSLSPQEPSALPQDSFLEQSSGICVVYLKAAMLKKKRKRKEKLCASFLTNTRVWMKWGWSLTLMSEFQDLISSRNPECTALETAIDSPIPEPSCSVFHMNRWSANTSWLPKEWFVMGTL